MLTKSNDEDSQYLGGYGLFHSYSIRQKLILFFMIVILIPSFLITTVMYYRSTRLLGEKKGISIINGLEQTRRVMDTILADAEYQLTYMTINPQNLAELMKVTRRRDYSKDQLTEMVWQRIYNYRVSNQNILAIYLYLYSPKLMFTSFENRQVIEVTNPDNYAWLTIPVHPGSNSSGWLPSFAIPGTISETARSSFILKKKIKSILINQPIGEACIAIEEYNIRHNLLASIREGPQGMVMLLDQTGTVLSAVTPKSTPWRELSQYPLIKQILAQHNGSFVARVNGAKMLVGFATSKYTGWKYVSMVPLREITLNTVEIRNLALLVNLLSASLAILLAWIFSQSIYHPILTLKEAMQAAENGDLEVRVNEERRDELAMLNRGFNRMINQIQRLITELYHEKLLKKEAELKNLQSQINPHFLYNTLDSIHWLARLNKMEEVSQLTFALSNFYKLSLSGGKETITARDTITLVQEYLKIQKVRYGEKITIELTYDQTLLDYQVLPLIIQPLVENAIYHGIEKKKGGGRIGVDLSRSAGGMVFTVRDDGCGIPPAKLAEIKQSLCDKFQDEGANFALVNIQRRIQLYYGTDYGLEIMSAVNEGTLVKVFLPCWELSKGEEARVDV